MPSDVPHHADARSQFDQLAKVFAALGDPVRLSILEFLLDTEKTDEDCAERFSLSSAQVERHLSKLIDGGYVATRSVGAERRFSVADSEAATLVRMARSMTADNIARLNTCSQIAADTGR